MLTMAQLRVAQGQPAKAVAEIERAVKAYPGIAALHYRLALARLAIYDLSGAVESLKEALAIQPDYREAELLLAQVNIRLGSTEAAIRTLAQLLERDPGLVQAHILLADAYRVRGQLDEVHKVFEKVARLYPTNPEPPLLKGLVLRQQGKAAEARACFEASLALAPNYVLPLEQLVQLDVAGKQFDAARARVRQYWERFPSNAYYPYLLGVVHLAETNLAEAEAALKKALELEPAFSAAESLLAQVYVAGGRQAEALGRLEQLIARNTNDVGSLIQLAELHTASSNYAAAATAYERVLAVNPGLPLAQNNLAWLYAQHLGRLDEAYELARRAYDSDPRNPYFADTFGWVLYRRGEYAHAAVLLGESARALPNEPEVWFHLGMAHYMLGEEHAARSALQKAVLLAGRQYWLEEARFRLAVLERDWTGKDAIAELDRELERDPRDPILLLRRARAWRTGGETEKAAQVYERLLKVQPKLVSALTELAQLYGWYLQNTNRALELARRARVLNPNDPVVALTLGRLAYRSGDHKWAYSLLNEGA
ncbi:MAG: tetratricopeptide repeat protein, partial [Verrucomicrobiae bacterium]|nr:tetratricopeptide repeat protein [Verrucomicrobiae bacterium]